MITIFIKTSDENEIKLNLDEIKLYNLYKETFNSDYIPNDEELVENYLNHNYHNFIKYWISYGN
jgi:hypothetical protein